MQRFDDEVIRNEKMFWTKLHYIHNNPVKAGLVLRPEDYKYSSARNYVCGNHSVLFADTEYAGLKLNNYSFTKWLMIAKKLSSLKLTFN